ncbi:MAG: C10 family peptidase [Bacteroidota bacterium]
MKKVLLFIIFVAFFIINSFSQIVPIATARTVAKNIYYERANIGGNIDLQDINFSQDFVVSNNQQPVYYVFNISNNRGFVIVAAEERSVPVLFYTFEGSYSTTNQPDNFVYWMKNYELQIVAARDANVAKEKKTTALWTYYSSTTAPNNKTSTVAVPILLTTNWSQDPYYNDLCPSMSGNHCPTGCVATAMAMIMKYHAYPTHGYGSHSYAHTIANGFSNNLGTLSANFGTTTYNWAAMPNSVNSTNTSVATLMYHCGVSVNMDYDINGSGAYLSNAQTAFMTYFIYSAQYATRTSYTDAAWTLLIKNSLDSLRPVLYGGSDVSYGGHAFVCDGYQNSGTYTNMFHFNWGWGGSSNGYVYLSNLTPQSSGMTFSQNQEIVYEIYPKPATLPVANFTSNKTSLAPNGLVVFTNTSTNNPLNYLWSITPNTGLTFTSGTSTSTKNIYVIFANIGYYTVSLTSSNSAGSANETKTNYIHVWIDDAGVEHTDVLQNIKLYPNPSNGDITIETDLELQGDVSCKIYDILGNEVLNILYTSGLNNNNIILNLSELHKGLYFIKITTSKGSITKRIELID